MNATRIYILIIAWGLTSSAWAQAIQDSLIALLQQETSYVKKLQISEEALSYLHFNSPDVAVELAKSLIEVKNAHPPVLLGNAYWLVAKAFVSNGQLDSVKYWNDKARSVYNQYEDSLGLGRVELLDAFVNFKNEDYDQALQRYLDAIRIAEKFGDEVLMADGNYRVGELFHFTYKMPESAQYAQKAAELYQNLGYRSMEADALSFAGHGLRLSGKLDQSLEYFEKGNQTARQLNDTAMLVQSMIDLASYYAENNDYQQAIQYYLDGIAISDTARWRQQMLLYGNLGQIYMYDGQHEKALPGLKMALKLSQQQDDDFFLTEWPEYIAQAHAGLNQYDSAYKYMKIAWISTDTIFTKDKNEALEEMRTRFETEKKEATISYQQAELGRQKTIQWLIVGILALTLLLLYLVYRNAARTKANMDLIRSKNEALEQQNEKIALLLKEIHHRTKNNMQMVSSLLNMQSMHVEDAKALDAVEASQNRVQSMALIHQKLYQGKDLISIDMQDYIQSLTDYLATSLHSADRNVDFTVQLPELVELDVDSAVSVGLILNELITNSYKYAFDKEASAHIKIGLVKKQENNVQLIFEDNGGGKHSQVQGTGFGSQLISILVKQLKADMKEWNDKGYHVSLSFKAKQISDLAA